MTKKKKNLTQLAMIAKIYKVVFVNNGKKSLTWQAEENRKDIAAIKIDAVTGYNAWLKRLEDYQINNDKQHKNITDILDRLTTILKPELRFGGWMKNVFAVCSMLVSFCKIFTAAAIPVLTTIGIFMLLKYHGLKGASEAILSFIGGK